MLVFCVSLGAACDCLVFPLAKKQVEKKSEKKTKSRALTWFSFHFFFYRLFFLQETVDGMSSRMVSSQPSDSFRFKRAAFYQSLKSKVGLAVAKAAAFRINLSVDGCGLVAAPVHPPSRAPPLLPRLLSHNLPLPRVH